MTTAFFFQWAPLYSSPCALRCCSGSPALRDSKGVVKSPVAAQLALFHGNKSAARVRLEKWQGLPQQARIQRRAGAVDEQGRVTRTVETLPARGPRQ